MTHQTLQPDWGASRHRKASVEKVENGFRVSASFLVDTKNYEGRVVRTNSSLEFVFYTVEEAILWLTNYLNAPSSDLDRTTS